VARRSPISALARPVDRILPTDWIDSRGGAIPLIDFLVERGAKLDVVNDRG
jgi:hypothetical protein